MDSMTKGKLVAVPVTILECPNARIFSVRLYKNGIVAKDILNEKIDKEMQRKVKLPKKEFKVKLETLNPNEYDDVSVIVYSIPKTTGIKKTPDMIEVGLNGNNVEEKLKFVQENLNKEFQRVPYDFNEPEGGGMQNDIDYAISPAIRLGVEGSLGTDAFRVKTGIDSSLNLFGFTDNAYRSPNSRVQREPIVGESYSFTQFTPHPYIFTPFVGIEGNVDDSLIVGVEVGPAITGFTLRVGRDTYSQWRTYRKDSDNTVGLNTRLFVNFHKPNSRDLIPETIFSLGYEYYEPELGGTRAQIHDIIGSFGLGWKF